MTFFSSSYKTSTNAPPMPLRTLDHAPLKKALPPSSLKIFRQQSTVPLYMMSAARETGELTGSFSRAGAQREPRETQHTETGRYSPGELCF